MKVQRFLRCCPKDKDPLEELKEKYSIRYSVSKDGKLVVLNYDMLDSDKNAQISKECRGLILEMGTWEIVSRAFDRFFNLGDSACAPINWHTAEAIQKIDGSLISLFFYDGQWRISTRGNIDALGELPQDRNRTFADVVWPLLETAPLEEAFVYILELASPWNRVVTEYNIPQLFLLTMRDKELDYAEVDTDYLERSCADQPNWLMPSRFGVCNPFDVQEAIENLGDREEGFVVVDGDRNRIKMKSLSYCELHKMANNGVPDFWALLHAKKDDDVVAAFPRFKEQFDERRDMLNEALRSAEWLWEENRGKEDQKEFALAVKDNPMSPLLFTMRKMDSDCTVKDMWFSMDHERASRMCEKRFGK